MKITADNWSQELLLDPAWHQWNHANNHINNIGYVGHIELYRSMVQWVEQSIADCYNTVGWLKMNDCIYFRFKNRADYLMFMLKFGVQE